MRTTLVFRISNVICRRCTSIRMIISSTHFASIHCIQHPPSLPPPQQTHFYFCLPPRCPRLTPGGYRSNIKHQRTHESRWVRLGHRPPSQARKRPRKGGSTACRAHWRVAADRLDRRNHGDRRVTGPTAGRPPATRIAGVTGLQGDDWQDWERGRRWCVRKSSIERVC